jgi:hypothetical protein
VLDLVMVMIGLCVRLGSVDDRSVLDLIVVMIALFIRLGGGDDKHDSTSYNTSTLLQFIHTAFSLLF